MNKQDIARLRLVNQQISIKKYETPEDMVQWMTAIQAQDFLGSLWAVGLRLPQATEQSIEKAIADKKIVRTWPMRGTIHFVSPKDALWMMQLMSPRVIRKSASRFRGLELDDEVFNKARSILEKEYLKTPVITRKSLMEILESKNISTKNNRGMHILGVLSMQGILCLGPRVGKQPSFVLFENWIPNSRKLSREESLAEITRRYFLSHGPATLRDLMWWTGLTMKEVKEGLDIVKNDFISVEIDNETYWCSPYQKNTLEPTNDIHMLSSFEEILLGYKDRTAFTGGDFRQIIQPGANGIINPVLMKDGKVVGTWKRVIKKDALEILIKPFGKFSHEDMRSLEKEKQRYAKFLGLPLLE